MSRLKNDLTGKIFGKLTVIKHMGNGNWLCNCECGNEQIVAGGDLNRGNKDNCGCLTKIKMSNKKKKYNTYDLTGEFGIGYTTDEAVNARDQAEIKYFGEYRYIGDNT